LGLVEIGLKKASLQTLEKCCKIKHHLDEISLNKFNQWKILLVEINMKTFKKIYFSLQSKSNYCEEDLKMIYHLLNNVFTWVWQW
jgi:hypothetical protein